MLRKISLDQVLHSRRRTSLVTHGKRIKTLINLALDQLGLLARGGCRPIGEISDVEPPAPSLEHVVEREASAAGLADLHAESDHLVVHEDRGLSAAGRSRLNETISQLNSLQFYPHGPAVPCEPPSVRGCRVRTARCSQANSAGKAEHRQNSEADMPGHKSRRQGVR